MEETGLSRLVVNDFSGGMTDYYIGGDTSQFQKAENFVINENRDLVTRPGTLYKYNARINSSYSIRNVINHDNDILMQAGPKVHHYTSSVQTVQSADGHDVFTDGDDDTRAEFSFWNNHTLGVSDDLRQPQKIYKDESGNWQCSNIGLPEIIYASSITLANDLKSKFNAHMADTSDHTTAADATNTVSAADASDYDTLITLVTELLTNYEAHEGDAELGSSWVYHAAQEASEHSLDSTQAPTTLFEAWTSLKDLKTKFNAHDADSTAHGVGSAHQSSAIEEPTIAGFAGSDTYIYAFYFVYRYNVEGVQFTEFGKTHLVEVDSITSPDTNVVTVGLPELDSFTKENWDDANVKIAIARTTNAGSVFYLVKEVDNGTSSTTDTMSDTDLVNQQPIYTEGGVLDDDMPPPAKHIAVVQDITIYGNVKVGSVTYPNRVVASKPNRPSACPGDFYEDFDGEVVGLSKVGIYPLIFLKDKVYRIEGRYDSRGLGGFQKRSVSQRIGCVSAKSIVETEDGVYFAGEEGFYYTNGSKVVRISSDFIRTYKALTNKDNIHGTFDKTNNRVLWAVQVDGDSNSNDQLYVAQLNYQTPRGGRPFTSWSGGRDADNFTASTIAYIDGVLYRADYRSYLLYHDDDTATDLFLDTTKTPENWSSQTLFYDYRSCALDFGNPRVRKWVSKFNINAENVSSLSLQVLSNNDNSGVFSDLKGIERAGNVEWGDPTILWGITDLRWNYFPVMSEWRRFPASPTAKLRCMYKQIRLENDYITIDTSDSGGTATVDGTANTVVLDGYPTTTWISDPVNYYISFDTDSYATEYLITAISTDTLTVADGSGSLADASGAAWKIKGYKKREILNILDYTISYKEITMSQQTYDDSNEAS